MLIELPNIAIVVLSLLFNAILSFGYYQISWENSLNITIDKPGKDLIQSSSYTQISLLPRLSKIFEKMLLSKMTPFLHENHIIPTHEYRFRAKHGTVGQVNRSIRAQRVPFSYFYVVQAFDKVWHKGILWKIKTVLPYELQ